AGAEGRAGPPRGPGRPAGTGAGHRRGAAQKAGAGPGRRDIYGQLRHRADPPGPAADGPAGREPAGAERAPPGPAGAGCRRDRAAGDDTMKGEVHTMKSKANNEVTLAFPSRSSNEGFARAAVSCFAAQMDPTLNEL